MTVLSAIPFQTAIAQPVTEETKAVDTADWYPYLTISILNYSEDSEDYLDPSLYGYPYYFGDPYFHVYLDYTGDGEYDEKAMSGVHTDIPHLENPFSYNFILFGEITTLKFKIEVYDADPDFDDTLDYCPSAGGTCYAHTLGYEGLKSGPQYFGPYNGEDDGVSGEKDCTISYKVELFNWNVPPIIDNIRIFGREALEVYSFEPFLIDSYVFDPNFDPISYTWDMGDGTTLTTSNDYVEHIFTEPGIYTVTLRATDSISTSSDSINIIVNEFPYLNYHETKIKKDEGTVQIGTDYLTTLHPAISTDEYHLGWPFEFTIRLSLVTDVQITKEGSANLEFIREDSGDYEVTTTLTSSESQYMYSIWPHFELFYVEDGKSYNQGRVFKIPIPTSINGAPLYPDQASIQLGNNTIYYWDRLVEIGSSSVTDSLGEWIEDENIFNIYQIDLIQYIDKLISTQVYWWEEFVEIADLFIQLVTGDDYDRVLNLNFNLDLKSIIYDQLWLHHSTGSEFLWDDVDVSGLAAHSNTFAVSPINYSEPYSVIVEKDEVSSLTKIYPYLFHFSMVQLSGTIDLEYGYQKNEESYTESIQLLDTYDFGLYISDYEASAIILDDSISVLNPEMQESGVDLFGLGSPFDVGSPACFSVLFLIMIIVVIVVLLVRGKKPPKQQMAPTPRPLNQAPPPPPPP